MDYRGVVLEYRGIVTEERAKNRTRGSSIRRLCSQLEGNFIDKPENSSRQYRSAIKYKARYSVILTILVQ